MASSTKDDFAGGDSLFEGMVFFSDLSSSPPPPPPLPPPSIDDSSDSITPQFQSQSQPLDEDLFSNLTLTTSQPQIQTLDSSDATPPNSQPPSRQISRKKKRAVRIGYARDSILLSAQEESSLSSIETYPDPQFPQTPQNEYKNEILAPVIDERVRKNVNIDSLDDNLEPVKASTPPELNPDPQISQAPLNESQDEILHPIHENKATETTTDGSIEDKLEDIRARISSKIKEIREKSLVLSSQRKELGRRRRKAMESANLASEEYKELERELEEACEAEDFERAERVSESLAEKEKEKDVIMCEVRDVEFKCDEVDSKMQRILELQIETEEEGVAMLEQFAKDAAAYADSVLKRAEEVSKEELEQWESSMECLEVNKIEMDIESQLISEACSGLENSIEYLVEDDRKEAEILKTKKCILSKELDELLAMVRLKEAEIAENDSLIDEVEQKISNVISEFHGTRSSIDMQHDNLQLSISKLESESEALFIKKKEIDEFILKAQQDRSELMEVARASLEEAKTSEDLVRLRKSLASSIMQSREDKVKLAKTEERILEEIQILRLQSSAARTALQDLSSTRVSIQQEIASYNQRISFIDKRGPALEAEKRVAAAARNFKEAGRIAAEAKALNAEKETELNKREKAVADLEKIEREIKDTVEKIQESEDLILLKEKEAAMAGCKRLLLVAACARAERSMAVEMGDLEEGESLLKEAEAAEFKASELQETYGLDPEEHEKTLDHAVSIAFIADIEGKRLVDIASSFRLSASGESQT